MHDKVQQAILYNGYTAGVLDMDLFLQTKLHFIIQQQSLSPVSVWYIHSIVTEIYHFKNGNQSTSGNFIQWMFSWYTVLDIIFYPLRGSWLATAIKQLRQCKASLKSQFWTYLVQVIYLISSYLLRGSWLATAMQNCLTRAIN